LKKVCTVKKSKFKNPFILARNKKWNSLNRVQEYCRKPGLWIRIGFGFSDFVDPDPYWESGSRSKKDKKFQWKNALLVFLK
jgi:hypothetical protein